MKNTAKATSKNATPKKFDTLKWHEFVDRCSVMVEMFDEIILRHDAAGEPGIRERADFVREELHRLYEAASTIRMYSEPMNKGKARRLKL